MADLDKIYPLSTSDGQSIPLDVIRGKSCVSKTFLSSASSTAITVPSTAKILEIYADQDVLIQFAASAAVAAALVDGTIVTDAIFVPANSISFISPPVDKLSLAMRGVTAGGTALINFLENWSGLSLQSQVTRR
jgi:hypothetical protein